MGIFLRHYNNDWKDSHEKNNLLYITYVKSDINKMSTARQNSIKG